MHKFFKPFIYCLSQAPSSWSLNKPWMHLIVLTYQVLLGVLVLDAGGGVLYEFWGRYVLMGPWNTYQGHFPFNKNSTTFQLHRPNPHHSAFCYCSCKEDTKDLYWGQQFCQMERDILVRPNKITGPVKVDHLQSWSPIFQ